MTSVDPARSFDRVAEVYEAVRPEYPPELLDAVPLSPDATVLDLGAGTGKLTRVLVRRYARVVALEPLDGMRAILERVVPEAESLAGTAEAIPLADASVDAVFAGQAFHWFANDDAVAEIARVLRPGGVFALAGNEEQEPLPLPEAYVERTRELFGGRTGSSAEEQVAAVGRGPFGEFREAVVAQEVVQSREHVLTLLSSTSAIAKLPEEEGRAILDELGALLPPGDYRFTVGSILHWTVRT